MARKEHYARWKEIQAEKALFASLPTAPCRRCGDECSGSLMRTSHKSTRARDYLAAPEVPRHPNGHGIQLCHFCQRTVFFAGGFLKLLAQELERAACDEAFLRKNPGQRPARSRVPDLAASLTQPPKS